MYLETSIQRLIGST